MGARAQGRLGARAQGRRKGARAHGGRKGAKGRTAYRVTKAGLISLTESVAAEVKAHGIDVNAICPGIVGTAMWHDHLIANQGETFEDRVRELVPLGRPSSILDIGEGVRYLATAENVTGVALNVAGGMVMN